MGELSIKGRFMLLSGCSLIGIALLLAGMSLYRMHNGAQLVEANSAGMLGDSARELLKARGESQSHLLANYFREGNDYGTAWVRRIQLLRSGARLHSVSNTDLRAELNQDVADTLRANPHLLSTYLVFEPETLDSSDAQFMNRSELGSNAKGRFGSFWARKSDGNLTTMALSEEQIADRTPMLDGTPYNTWYECPLRTGKPCLLNPYFDDTSGRKVLMTSLVFPVIDADKVVAVAGMDINLDELQALSVKGQQALYQGHSNVRVISTSGLMAGSSRNPEDLGKPIGTLLPEQSSQILQQQAAGIATVLENAQSLQVLTPLQPIPGEPKMWSILLEVPNEEVMAPALVLQSKLQQLNRNGIKWEIIAASTAVLLGLLLAWLIAARLIRPLRSVASMLQQIASGEGDLTQRLHYARQDELGELTHGFNCFLDKLQPIVAQVQRSGTDIRLSADSALDNSGQTSAAMQQQQREIDQAATAVNEMSATAHDVASNAAQAVDAARNAEAAASEGMQVIASNSQSIVDLAQDMSRAMTEVEGLANSSEKIGSVLDVIRSIAEQTNLLALNAAIEAARAGDAGRGFAVVADEVRHLAKRTQESVVEIHQVIGSLQSGARNVVMSINTNHTHAQAVAQQSIQTNEVLQRVDTAIDVISQMNLQIAAAAEEQSQVAEEINRNISGIRDVTTSLTARAEESAVVSRTLHELADQQQKLLSTLKV
nr:methyl-accepting chemotaxis protein [Pseudomonas aeruginosa]